MKERAQETWQKHRGKIVTGAAIAAGAAVAAEAAAYLATRLQELEHTLITYWSHYKNLSPADKKTALELAATAATSSQERLDEILATLPGDLDVPGFKKALETIWADQVLKEAQE